MLTRKQRAELEALILKRCQMTAEFTFAEAGHQEAPMTRYRAEVDKATDALNEFIDSISEPPVPDHALACAKHYVEVDYVERDYDDCGAIYEAYERIFGEKMWRDAIEEVKCSTQNS